MTSGGLWRTRTQISCSNQTRGNSRRDEQVSVSTKTATLHEGESVTKCTVGQSGLDFDLQTGDIAADRSISMGKVEFSFR
jgi:hypothetical protein